MQAQQQLRPSASEPPIPPPCAPSNLLWGLPLHPQVTVHPDPPVLKAGATTELEVRYRPLLVGAADAALRLECAELGLYEWGLRLAGTAVNPERGLAFSVPLGGREAQVFRWVPAGGA